MMMNELLMTMMMDLLKRKDREIRERYLLFLGQCK